MPERNCDVVVREDMPHTNPLNISSRMPSKYYKTYNYLMEVHNWSRYKPKDIARAHGRTVKSVARATTRVRLIVNKQRPVSTLTYALCDVKPGSGTGPGR